jgi:hypothetical protein
METQSVVCNMECLWSGVGKIQTFYPYHPFNVLKRLLNFEIYPENVRMCHLALGKNKQKTQGTLPLLNRYFLKFTRRKADIL